MKPEDLRTVMYVDDEPDIREIVELSLGLAPQLLVHTRHSGESALKSLDSLRPDLVMLDVMMPGTDGPTTLQRIRAQPQHAHIPVVFVTAKALPQEITRFINLGAAGVIAKPFNPMTLADDVLALWEKIA